jgi:hypothetical protein
VLADTGHQLEVSLRLPVLAETGIIEPGAFVEYQDGSVTRWASSARPRWKLGCPRSGRRWACRPMHNLYEQFRQLIPDPPLQAGTVIDVGSGVVTVALPGGGRIKARGSAALGQKVFVRDDAIEGIAPSLTLEIIEI